MTNNSRSFVDDPISLYVGDVVEGAVAAEQVAAGNAEALAEIPADLPGPAEEVAATSAAQAHAELLEVDLAQVEGTGADGQIVKANITDAYAEAQAKAAQSGESNQS